MIDGKVSYVFSGDDDHEVIIPLPYAFLRLIASGIFAYDVRWLDDGWDDTEITSEQLTIVEESLALITRVLNGEKMPVMHFIEQSQYQLFSESYIFVDGYKIQITPSMLPAEAGDCSAIFVSLNINFPYYGVNVQTRDLIGNANRYTRIPNAGQNRMDLIIPMSNGGGQISVTALNGDSITWDCGLVGWW